ncbi:MAG: glycoside hydrolase 5 family protein [Acidimicrobiales bacterium]
MTTIGPRATSGAATSAFSQATRAPWPPSPSVWVGANFWSRAGGPRMWAHYDRDVVRQELAVLKDNGCTLTRSFCYWADFMPAPEVLDDEVMARFADFLDLHQQAGLATIPTFIVGHMSGANWDPAWRGERDLYRDVWLVAQQAWFVAEVARRNAQHPAIAAWLLTNEMPLYGRNGDQDAVTSWARLLVQALRSAGATQPVGTGDGAWGIETSGADNGFSLRRLAPLVDFIGPHIYPMSDDPVRQMLSGAFLCELCGHFGKPVVLEEFGVSSDFVSGENAAHYYRQVLHSTLLAGARGWIAWNNCDYDNLFEQEPYTHHPFEMHFGLTSHDGKPKPQLLELARFSKLIGSLSEKGWGVAPAEVGLWVPELYEHDEPSWSRVPRDGIKDDLFQSYIAAREAGLPVRLVRERDLVQEPQGAPGLKLYLLACSKLVTAPGMKAALRLAEQGALVYASYFAGSTRNQLGPWMPWIEESFGVRQHLRYGLVDPIEDEVVTFQLVADLGDLPSGSRLVFKVAGSPDARAFLPVEPAGAEVLAVDGHGRPALLRNRKGLGSMLLCTYPVEHMAACRPEPNPEDTWRLYSALAAAANVHRPLRSADPRLAIGGLLVGGKEAFLAMNLSASNLRAPLSAEGRHIYLGDDAVTEVDLGPYEVALLYLG